MKPLQTFLIILLVGLTNIIAQNNVVSKGNWVKIVTEKEELSIVFPKEYLVHFDSFNNGKRTSVLGFENGVSMELTFYNTANSKENLSRIPVDESKKPSVFNFKADGFIGKSIISNQNGYENRIFISTKKSYFVIEINAESKEKPEVVYALNSIKIKGQKLFTGDSELQNFTGETVSVEKLEKSSQVEEALKRKSEKIKRKVTFEPLSAYREEARDFSVRPAFVLDSLRLDFNSLPVNVTKGGEVRIVAKLLANGQVGDITVYSDVDKMILNGYANFAAKMKFVPAQGKDGNPVDSTQTFWSYFSIRIQTFIVRKITNKPKSKRNIILSVSS